MTVKQILDNFASCKPKTSQAGIDAERKRIEKLLIEVNKCFVDVILPSVFEVQEDLQQAGFWNQLNIGQSSVLTSGKPNIRNVELFFYPERIQQLPFEASALERTYRALFEPSADLRKILMQIRFPQRLNPVREDQNRAVAVEKVNTAMVNSFLEEFILGSIEIYQSDHLLS